MIAETLAEAGHRVYASMRGLSRKNSAIAENMRTKAAHMEWSLLPIELDVLSEASARVAVDKIIAQHGRIDVLINNAGVLVVGVTEAFTPEQLLRTFNTNCVSWLRTARAVLPHMRSQQDGLMLYIGSVTSRILSPFQGPYIASKGAGDALAETMHYENSRYGIDTVIVQPGAYTSGTNHFAGAQHADDKTVTDAYDRIADLPSKLAARLNDLNRPGVRTDIAEVAERIRHLIEQPKGERPFRVVVDPQDHGAVQVNAVAAEWQRDFMQRFGIEDLLHVTTGDLAQRTTKNQETKPHAGTATRGTF